MNSSQIFDLVVAGTLLFCAWKGASRGLVSQATWIVALILCFKFSGELAPAIEPIIAVQQPLKKWIAMAIVYLGLCLVSFVAAGILNSWLEKANLKDFDRHLGALLGFLKGVIICMTAIFFGLTLSESAREVISTSRAGYVAASLMHHLDPLLPLVPEGAKDTVNNVRDTFNRKLGQPVQDEDGGWSLPNRDPQADADDDFRASGSSDRDRDVPSDRESSEPASSWWENAVTGREGGAESRRPATDSKNGPTLSELLNQMPEAARTELTSKSMQYLREATESERRRLMDEFRKSAPETASDLVDDFVRSRSGQTETFVNSIQPKDLSRTSTALLEQISEIYDNSGQVRSDAEQYLRYVPEKVQRGVLEDWHSDILQFQNDPDPGTTGDTPLRDRIVRQLKRAGISVEDLDRAARTRLGLGPAERR